MPRCFVTDCKSGHDSARPAAENRHFSNPPNDASRLQEGQHAIPRCDRELTSSGVVCDLHFQEEDIVKNFVHNIGGDVVVIPRDKWGLKDDALPRLFPNCLQYLSQPVQKRQAPAARPLQPKRRNVQDDAEQEETAPNTFHCGEVALCQAASRSIAPSPCSKSYRQWRKSLKAYTLISDMQLLPLPTKARLRQITSDIPCKYRCDEVALSTIKRHFQGKSHTRRHGVLLLDEIKLKQSVAFNKVSCKMDVFVDYGVTDTLERTKDAHQEEKFRLHDVVEAKMIEITTASADASEQGPSDHAYYRGEAEDTVAHYLCGYAIHKFTKHATNHLSIEDISSDTPLLASDSYITEYRSFKQGSLKHPTQKMLIFMKIAKKIVSACLDKEGLCGDIFWKVLEE
ncbi:hypothetical protein HPB49_002811 [Dermacentor silvarum]|uniref:Uncharacterized protein n=1 Tax=Dermacentor silvarum TaxID=543639 RepID=A0ACB8DLU0_DERSI|nr:hypothetical protein HPB49_002811 [Dermacentor silvarum]